MEFEKRDIGTYLTPSRTREGVHIVDAIEKTCSCEGFQIRKTCQHLTTLMNTTVEPTQELELVPKSATDIDAMKRANPEAAFDELSQEIAPILEQSKALTVADAGKLAVVKVADEYRKDVKKLRCAVEVRRKELVADLNKQTKDINGAAGKLWDICEKEEARLLEIIEHAEREATRIQAEKRAARTAEISPFLNGPLIIDIALAPDEDYAALLASSKEAHAQRIEYARKAKEEADAIAKAEAEELERVRLENEQLKKEAEEREAAAKKERAAAAAALAAAQDKAREEAITASKAREEERKRFEDESRKQREHDAALRAEAEAQAKKERDEIEAKARAEKEAADKENARLSGIAEAERQKAATAAREAREAREKIEREDSDRKAAEAKAAAEKAAAEEAAALAPDKEKLYALAATVRAISVPSMVTEKGVAAMSEVEDKVEAFAKWIEKKAATL